MNTNLPKWIIHPDSETAIDIADYVKLIDALSIAIEALEAIQKHQKTLMNDSGLVMSTTYMISHRALKRIEELGGDGE